MNQKEKYYQYFKVAVKSIWLFPVIITVVLILLTSLKVNGSSMGVYYDYFFGNPSDPSLISNHPRTIRSDEWVVNTQMAIAQSNDGFREVNKNLGNGADMSLIVDAPYSGFTQLFKPHNFSFFVLPFDYAFAFKWWVMGYLLILSVYFFVIAILPKQKGVAAGLSLAFFFAPFVQWWYQYITLAPIFYVLFSGTIFIYLSRVKNTKNRILLSIALAYVLICFALVQYPAFQIPCAWAMLLFLSGYLLELRSRGQKKIFKNVILYALASCVVALSVTGVFLYEKREQVETIANTVYPGKRLIHSGSYSITHLLSSHLSYQFQDDNKAKNYSIKSAGATNQSESSNFILLIPFLILPSLYLIGISYRRNRSLDYPLSMTLLGFTVIMLWLFIPGLELIGKITLLDKVPAARLLIGLGILNLLCIILFMRLYSTLKTISIPKSFIYSVCVWVILIIIGWRIHSAFPLFISMKSVIVFSTPVALSIFMLLRKRNNLSILILCLFSIFSTASINPLYRGTDILTKNNLSIAIQSFAVTDNKRWVMEDSFLQSFAFMNGKPSLTGIYEYPHLSVWKSINSNQDIYNRYAHVNFVFDRDANRQLSTNLKPNGSDHFGVFTEPCSEFMKSSDVGYIVTSGTFTNDNAPCAHLVQQITFPTATYSIYSLSF